MCMFGFESFIEFPASSQIKIRFKMFFNKNNQTNVFLSFHETPVVDERHLPTKSLAIKFHGSIDG